MSETHRVPAGAAVQSIEQVVAAHRRRPGAFLSVLERLQQQSAHSSLTADVVQEAARLLNIPASQAYGVVTFYAFFNLKPQGRRTIAICRGTACHTRGSRQLLDSVRSALDLSDTAEGDAKTSQTSADNEFTVRTVACFGQCALAPVVELDRTILGHMNRQKLLAALQRRPAARPEQGGGRP